MFSNRTDVYPLSLFDLVLHCDDTFFPYILLFVFILLSSVYGTEMSQRERCKAWLVLSSTPSVCCYFSHFV